MLTTIEQPIKINLSQMLEILKAVSTHSFIHLETATTVRMNKTNNPYHNRIKKHSTGNFQLCPDYSKRVNNNRLKEGEQNDFVPQTPKGKKHLSPCVLIDTATESKYYLMVEYYEEIQRKVEYRFEGTVIPFENFKHYLPAESENKSQGLDRTVNVLTYGFESIVGFSLNGNKYIVV